MKIESFFEENKRFALAYSGGVDSSYLLYEASKAGLDFKAYFLKAVFVPSFEFEEAIKFARENGVEPVIIEANPLASDEVRANPSNRCYYCKTMLFSKIIEKAKADGYDMIIDGTNASDPEDDRPGMKALRELGVRSPLREVGLTKAEIRSELKKAGIPMWNKPAYACLATRIPHGMELTVDVLKKVEVSEKFLMEMGFSDFRVRVFEDSCRIEVREEQLGKLISEREAILGEFKKNFKYVMLDLEVRK